MSEFVSIEPSRHNPYSDYYNKSKKFNLKFALIIGLLVIAIAATIAVVISSKNGDQNDENIANLVDPGEVDETLNSHLTELLSSAPHTDYSTLSAETPYLNASTNFLPISSESNYNDESLVYAAAFSILKQRIISPQDLSDEENANFANDIDVSITQSSVINSKALNYYLDQESVVIFYAKGDEPFSQDGKWVLVYAGQPELGIYYYYTSGQLCAEGCEAPFVINKLQLFSALQSDEQFYILSNITGVND